MRVIFVEPNFPKNQRQFVRALADVGAEVIGIGESPQEYLDDELKNWMTHYHQVPNVVDAGGMTNAVRGCQDKLSIDRLGAMTEAVRWLEDHLWIDLLEATIDWHAPTAAWVREPFMIPVASLRTAWLC